MGASLRGMPASCDIASILSPQRLLSDINPYLQLQQCKAPSSANTAVVFDRGATDNRSEFVDWSRSDGGSFRETGGATAGLAAWLVEVHADTALPVLVEMVVRNLLVVLDRLVRVKLVSVLSTTCSSPMVDKKRAGRELRRSGRTIVTDGYRSGGLGCVSLVVSCAVEVQDSPFLCAKTPHKLEFTSRNRPIRRAQLSI